MGATNATARTYGWEAWTIEAIEGYKRDLSRRATYLMNYEPNTRECAEVRRECTALRSKLEASRVNE